MALPDRLSNVAAARVRFGDRVDRLAPYLTRVDPLADAVVESIEGMRDGWNVFTQAAAKGIDMVPNAPASFHAFFEQAESVPVWVDWEQLDRGGEVLMRAGLLGGMVLGVKSLVLGYASPGGNKPLVFSGRLEKQALRRLNETARFVQATCRPGGLKPRSEGYQITLRVRIMHAQVRRMLLRSGRWDAQKWGAPINQHDMAGTSLLFSIVVLQGLRQLGMRLSAEESDAYMQLWRYSSYLIGVDQTIAPTSEAEAQRLGDLIAFTMGEPDDDSRALTRALLFAGHSAAVTPWQKKNEERRTRFASALCRELIGQELADKLDVPKTRWRYLLPFFRKTVASVEMVRENVPYGEHPQIFVGTRYWDRVVEVGLAGATAEFGLPERLAA
jgi:phage-related protein